MAIIAGKTDVTMAIVFGWIILSIVAGVIGSDRTCGFFGAFLGSLFLSPIIGFIIVLASSKSSTVEFQKMVLEEKKLRIERDKVSTTPAPSETVVRYVDKEIDDFGFRDVLKYLDELEVRHKEGVITIDQYNGEKEILKNRIHK